VIVCRKPITLYHVDLIGLAVLAGLAATAWWFVVLPWQQTWHDHHELAVRCATLQTGLRQDALELKTYEQGLADLRAAIAGAADTVPHIASIARQLRNMTDIAQAAGIEIQSVTPQPAQQEGEYVVNDIQVAGRGRSVDFIRFLDQLAEANPYQMLQDCLIQRPADEPDATCRLSWSVRLYLLPASAAATVGGRP
jgi:Tfp pilus assembly protein PilO